MDSFVPKVLEYKRQRVPTTAMLNDDSPPTKRRCASPDHAPSVTVCANPVNNDKLTKLDAKWRAVARFLVERASNETRHVTNQRVEQIARQHGLKSAQHLRRLVKRGLCCGLTRRPGSGRITSVSTPAVTRFVLKQIVQHEGDISLDDLTRLVRERFGVGCRSSISAIVRKLHFRQVFRRVVPFITKKQQADRLEWCRAAISGQGHHVHNNRTVRIFIDEKWFYGTRLKKRVFTRPGFKTKLIALASKTHISKVMFLAGVAEPNEERAFDGQVGIWPLVEQTIAARDQRHFNKGDSKHVLVSMTKERFVAMVKEKVCVAALKKVGHWANKIIIQMDSAGGHGGGRKDIAGTTLAELTEWANARPLPKILRDALPTRRPAPEFVFVAQPARSPDLNLLDLGAWNSINAIVPEVSHALSAGAPIEQIIANVKRAWEQWNSLKKVEITYGNSTTDLAISPRIPWRKPLSRPSLQLNMQLRKIVGTRFPKEISRSSRNIPHVSDNTFLCLMC